VGTLVLAALVALALTVRVVAGSWFHPAAILAGVWVLNFAVPVLGGLGWTWLVAAIILAILLGMLGCAVVTVRAGEGVARTPEKSGRTARLFVLGGGAAAVVSALLIYRANGVAVGLILNLDTATLATPPLATLLLAWTYGAALLAPFVAAGARGARGLLLLATPTLGAGLYALATTVKASLMIAVCITAGSWMMVHALRSAGRPSFRPKIVLGSAVSAVALLVGFVYFTAARRGGWTPSTRRDVVDNVLVYAGGGLPALGQWLETGPAARQLGWGVESLAGVSNYVMGDPTLGSAYVDIRNVGRVTTNVYTILRPLIEDFGVAGAVGVIVASALLAAHLYRRAVLVGSVGSALLVSAWSGVMLFSLATNILTFTNVCLGLGVALLLGRRWISLVPLQSAAEPEPQSAELPRPPTRAGRARSTLMR
jgi:oligosaccharide repeat unit polymerase